MILGSGGRIAVGAGIDQAALTLGDGTIVDLEISDDHVEIAEPLPIGCHLLTLGGPALDETSTIVNAPLTMPTSAALIGGAAVFAPAYALWEHDAPLPSFNHLTALGRALPTFDVNTLITLPLYAAFLDEPFDPSPYAPISRLHWNEVYLDDELLPEAPVPNIGQLVDWRSLGRRRRTQLLDAVGELPDELSAEVREWAASNPDVTDYARFRAKVAVDSTDASRPSDVVDFSHQLAQYLAHLALSRLHDAGTAAFALDLPIGSHPLGFETWAHADLFAPGMGVGAPPGLDVSGRAELGVPTSTPRRRRAQRVRVMAAGGATVRPVRLDVAYRSRARCAPAVVDPRRDGPW